MQYFSYDEIIALVKRKKALWLKRLHQVDSDSRDDFQALSGYVAACDFIIQDFAAKATDKRRQRLFMDGLAKSMYLPIAKVVAAIDAEEEFDGDIPQDIFETASASPEAMAEALRVACRLTKQGIKRRVEALK